MAYTGNTPTTQSFISGTDVFAVSAPTTVFTLSRPTASVNDIEVWVGSTALPPTTGSYSVSGTTLTLVSSVSSGNVYVRYLSTTTQQIVPASNTVGQAQLSALGTPSTTTFLSSTGTDLNWTSVNISTADITGTLAIANGGTGASARQDAMDALAGSVISGQYLRGNGTDVVMSTIQAGDVPTLNQNTTGTAANVTGTVAVANGGTGQTTQQAALNALSGSLSGTSGRYLRSDGTNVSLTAIQAGDVPTLNQNTTGNASTATTATTATTANALNTSNNYQINCLGVNTAPSGTAGEIRATGNVTAGYSDERLKRVIEPIEHALEKVRQLNGFIYEPNDLAISLGCKNIAQPGLSAQKVQTILPQAVVPSPVGEQYLTIHYERLIPLLVNAINELAITVEVLSIGNLK